MPRAPLRRIDSDRDDDDDVWGTKGRVIFLISHRIQAQGHFEMFLYFVKMTQTFSRLNQVARGNFSNRLSSIPTRLAPHFAIFKSIRLQLPSYSTT